MNQALPAKALEREVLRSKGQFWTPSWVAKAMVRYALAGRAKVLFDPAVGPGTFFLAARQLGFSGEFAGCELDSEALYGATRNSLSTRDLANIQVADFLSLPKSIYPAIISNPPYIRHHRIPIASKERFQREAKHDLGIQIDGRAGLHVYFFIRCLQMLRKGGRLAFIVSADICEGVFAKGLWTWVCENFRLDAVLTFSPEAAPFPGVDTNAIVFLIRNKAPVSKFLWGRVDQVDEQALDNLVESLGDCISSPSIYLTTRTVSEGLRTGFSRPQSAYSGDVLELGEAARVMRGIATGANNFFVMTRNQMKEAKLSPSLFIRCVGRTRDCPDDRITSETLEALERANRPTWLLNLPNIEFVSLPQKVQAYIQHGRGAGLPERALIKSRRIWYRMEQRKVPPILFAYLGRRSSRFILNEAGVVPLTGFLCVYPRHDLSGHAESLCAALNDPATIVGLRQVGKSYGDGAIKVEPRALEKLALRKEVLIKYGVNVQPSPTQLILLEPKAHYRACKKSD